MTFEFIIVYQPQEDEPILGILRERLRVSLVDNLNDVEDENLARMVWTNFERGQPGDVGGATSAVLGFSLELPDEIASIRDVVDQFAGALMTEPVLHAIKCEDPLLQMELAGRSEELFALEMKLRRVLSIIYLHADRKGDPYDLLTDESVQPMSKEKSPAAQMKAAAENQFFHLTFGQYVGLNQRPAIKDLGAIIRNEETYEAFRVELLRQPVQHEDDAVFLASLKDRMDAIEKMRNCVAHNRRPSDKVNEAYLNARPLVHQALDDYLGALAADWEDSIDIGPLEDYEAKQAVRYALENAEWNEENHVVRLPEEDMAGHPIEVHSREELEETLRGICETVWYGHAYRDEGEWIGSCDDWSWVAEALEDFEDRIQAVFPEEDAEEPENEE